MSLVLFLVLIASTAVLEGNYLLKSTELTEGNYSMIFSAPEAILGVHQWRDMLIKPPYSTRVAAIAVDEAHCVSKWYYYNYFITIISIKVYICNSTLFISRSKDFRRTYGRLGL